MLASQEIPIDLYVKRENTEIFLTTADTNRSISILLKPTGCTLKLLLYGLLLTVLAGVGLFQGQAEAQIGGSVSVDGNIYVRDGKRWRPDDRRRMHFNRSIELSRISTNRLSYLLQEDTCADQTVGYLYTDASKDDETGIVFLIGEAEMRYGACSPSNARFVKSKKFQCYVPPGQTTPNFRMRMTQNDQDDIVEFNFMVRNTAQSPYNGSPAQCEITDHIN